MRAKICSCRARIYIHGATACSLHFPQKKKKKERKKERSRRRRSTTKRKKERKKERKIEEKESTVLSLSRSNFLTTGKSFFVSKVPFYLRSLKVMGKLIHSFNVQNNDQTTTGRHLSHLQGPGFYQLLKWFTWPRNRSDLLNIITGACTNMSTHHSSKSLYRNRSDYNMIKVLPSRCLHCLHSCNVPMKISFGWTQRNIFADNRIFSASISTLTWFCICCLR